MTKHKHKPHESKYKIRVARGLILCYDLYINYLVAIYHNFFIFIVRVTNVHIERGYVYCSLFFTSKNKLITVRHIMQKSTNVLWKLTDKGEYDELMSRKLWYEAKDEELLEFDF